MCKWVRLLLKGFLNNKSMNKIKSVGIIVLVLISSIAVAQRNPLNMDSERFFRLGLKGGVNANKIIGQSYKEGFNYNYQVGGFMQFNFSRRFGIQPEVSFVQNTTEFSDDNSLIYDDLFFGGSQREAKLNYLEVPILLNLNIGTSKRVKLQLGPSYGALLSQTVDSLRSGGNIYKNTEFSAIGGVWIQLPAINFGGRYKLGLTNINDIDNREKWKNQAIQIFAGITF
jgi:hypothetical protein